MAKNVLFVNFVHNNGKLKLTPVNMRDGRSWTSMYVLTPEGDKIYVSPPQNTNNQVVDATSGEVLVDFNLTPAEIKAQLEAHKDKLVILRGNKNYDSPEEEEIPVLTLVSKFADVEEIDVDI